MTRINTTTPLSPQLIDAVGRSPKATSGGAVTPGGWLVPASTQIDISAEGRARAQAATDQASSPEALLALREQIRNGSYTVDTAALATALLQRVDLHIS